MEPLYTPQIPDSSLQSPCKPAGLLTPESPGSGGKTPSGTLLLAKNTQDVGPIRTGILGTLEIQVELKATHMDWCLGHNSILVV